MIFGSFLQCTNSTYTPHNVYTNDFDSDPYLSTFVTSGSPHIWLLADAEVGAAYILIRDQTAAALLRLWKIRSI